MLGEVAQRGCSDRLLREVGQRGCSERLLREVAYRSCSERLLREVAQRGYTERSARETPWVEALFYVKYARRKYEIVDKPAFVVTQRRH